MELIDTVSNIIDDFLPSFFYLADDFKKTIKENTYESLTHILLIIKLVVYVVIFIRMFYFLYFKEKTSYSSSVSLKLLIVFLNMLVLIFILTNMKDKIIKKFKIKNTTEENEEE